MLSFWSQSFKILHEGPNRCHFDITSMSKKNQNLKFEKTYYLVQNFMAIPNMFLELKLDIK